MSTIIIFQREIHTDKWFYPCSKDDLEQALPEFPEEDKTGIHAIGLAPCTHKNMYVEGVYFRVPQPYIEIRALPSNLQIKIPNTVKYSKTQLHLQSALEYGMKLTKEGNRIIANWNATDLRAYTLEFLLAHEIGHHVYYLRNDNCTSQSTQTKEGFANMYAMQHIRKLHGRGNIP